MPKSCRSILKSLMYKGAIDEKTMKKLERNLRLPADTDISKFEGCGSYTAAKTTMPWEIPWEHGEPKKAGRYLVTTREHSYNSVNGTAYAVDMCTYGTFETYYGERKKGWHKFDSEYGDYEVDNVVAWYEPAAYIPKWTCTVVPKEGMQHACPWKHGSECRDTEHDCPYAEEVKA